MTRIVLPEQRGEITIKNVLAAEPGIGRDEMILLWYASVLEAYQTNRDAVIDFCHRHLNIQRI